VLYDGRIDARAFDCAAFDALLAAKREKETAAAESREAKRSKPDPKAELDQQHERRVQRWIIEWLQRRVAAEIGELDAASAVRWLLEVQGRASHYSVNRADEAAQSRAAVARARKIAKPKPAQWKGSLDDEIAIVRRFLAHWAKHAVHHSGDLSAEDLFALGRELNICLEAEWGHAELRDYCELLTADRLRSLACELKVEVGSAEKRDELRAEIVAARKFACPQEVVSLWRAGR
jgi:hypothetical protein